MHRLNRRVDPASFDQFIDRRKIKQLAAAFYFCFIFTFFGQKQPVLRFEVHPEIGRGAKGFSKLAGGFGRDVLFGLDDFADHLLGAAEDGGQVLLGPDRAPLAHAG